MEILAIFKHDRAKARREGKCLACGQAGHFRPECPVVAPENRQTLEGSGSDSSPKAPSKAAPRGKAKAKSAAQAKGVTEDSGSKPEGAAASSSGNGPAGAVNQEALLAEAAKLLKGVSLKPLRLQEPEVDLTWVRSALTSASDPTYCLVDSGATNALRPASDGELKGCRVIRVDLASGVRICV